MNTVKFCVTILGIVLSLYAIFLSYRTEKDLNIVTNVAFAIQDFEIAPDFLVRGVKTDGLQSP